jgi:uncharacterized protein YgbK (DUF1537 family)
MMVYAILADDFTGAADTGIEFARAGWRTRALHSHWQAADLAGAEVVVIDTASRALPPAAAYAEVHRQATALKSAGAQVIFKKIDSTLRGSLGPELDAVLDACGLALAIVCPAFPAAGRTLEKGVLCVHGLPVAQTASGRDPITPVKESRLPILLAQTARRPVAWFALPRRSSLRAQAGRRNKRADSERRLAARWLAQMPQGGLAVVDACTQEDLRRIARSALASPLPVLLAGSAGLARPLAAALAQARGKAWRTAHPAARGARRAATPTGAKSTAPVLVLCGSLHPTAHRQMDALQEQLTRDDFWLLATPAALQNGWASVAPAQAIAQHAAAWLQTHTAAGVVIVGGDTLESFLSATHARGIDLERTLAAGVPLGRVSGGPCNGLRIASKAGGFGDADTLVQAVRFVRQLAC